MLTGEITEPPKRSTPRKHGCLWYGIFIGGILVQAVVWIGVASPDLPPSSDRSDPEVVPVSKKQRTYLETEVFWCNECIPQPTMLLELYYTQLGGWFQSTERVLLLRTIRFDDSDKVRFQRLGEHATSPIEIFVGGAPKEESFYKFTPPATFRQGYSTKPIINK